MSLPVGSHQASIRKRLKELKRSAVPAGRVPLSHSWPAPSERPTSQGGFAAWSPPLRSGGLLLPPNGAPRFQEAVSLRLWPSPPAGEHCFPPEPLSSRFQIVPPLAGEELL